jgi:hypothetical protein
LLRWRLCDGRVFLAVLGCGVRAVFLARPCWVGSGVLAVGAPCTVCGGWPGWARYGAAVQLYALCSASAVCLLPCAVAGCPPFCAGHMLWGAHRAPCGCRMRRWPWFDTAPVTHHQSVRHTHTHTHTHTRPVLSVCRVSAAVCRCMLPALLCWSHVVMGGS